MGLFSGDGTGCSARLFKKYGANVTFGLHLKMPDCIGDIKLLKKPLAENKALVQKANQKIDRTVEQFSNGKAYKNGLSFYCRMVGFTNHTCI